MVAAAAGLMVPEAAKILVPERKIWALDQTMVTPPTFPVLIQPKEFWDIEWDLDDGVKREILVTDSFQYIEFKGAYGVYTVQKLSFDGLLETRATALPW
jgi:hypothetical protein